MKKKLRAFSLLAGGIAISAAAYFSMAARSLPSPPASEPALEAPQVRMAEHADVPPVPESKSDMPAHAPLKLARRLSKRVKVASLGSGGHGHMHIPSTGPAPETDSRPTGGTPPEAGERAVVPPSGGEPVVPRAEARPADEAPPKPAENKSILLETTYAFGAGLDRLPRWMGSAKQEVRPVPFIDINWRDRIEFSTVKGLIVDVLYGERWHGGLIGTMVWGRSTRDLAGLNVPTRQNTLQAGLYLEYALTPAATLGVRVRQDLQNTGTSYGELYAEYELPKIGYLEHDVRLSREAMNRTGMRRFFGLSEQDAARLGVRAYSPGAGASKTALTYEGFMPTSESTGIAFSATVGRLGQEATASPLIRNFGSPIQREIVAAFVYHF